ncbi:MAG TPA: rhodanese-like domain-containing protein [Casimicrobiaceae bacterium]|jgi:rhodanese-related sulfurtransferase|nr:rhodanese-like domain-containing protein [Casimicrobiaceae bacterium]
MAFVQENWLLILVFVLSGAMLAWQFVAPRFSAVKNVNTVQATQLINRQNALLLDVREPKEFEGGRLPAALHIPLSQLAGRAAELAKYATRPVIAYCESGRRSRMAGGTLSKAGFKEVYSLEGGLAAWKKDGLPVEK